VGLARCCDIVIATRARELLLERSKARDHSRGDWTFCHPGDRARQARRYALTAEVICARPRARSVLFMRLRAKRIRPPCAKNCRGVVALRARRAAEAKSLVSFCQARAIDPRAGARDGPEDS